MRTINNERNLSMLVDFYELTMAYGYFTNGLKDTTVVFDMFFRNVPDKGGFVICAGLEQLIEYVQDLHFSKEDIEFLRQKGIFSEEFLAYLENFKFTGDIYAVEEGTPVYPNTPLVTVKAKIIDAQLIETMLLLTINHQSLIATKANRMVRAAKGRLIMEFGARRAHGYDAAVLGARAAYIGGVDATATLLSDQIYGVPAIGTMAHSWVQLFPTEYDAFLAYAKAYPDNCSLLIDTYDVLHSGLANAIKVSKEYLEPMGKKLKGVRIDSGDLAYLSKKIRHELDKNGLQECKIIVSNSIDEYLVKSLLDQGAPIDSFGIGERLITSKSEPVFGGVYKLSAVEKNGVFEPRIKLSENIEKTTHPGFKELWRLYDKNTGFGTTDVLTLKDESIQEGLSYIFVDPKNPWYKRISSNFIPVKLQKTIFKDGKLVYDLPSLECIREKVKNAIQSQMWIEEQRFENPHQHYVNLSERLYDVEVKMIQEHSLEKGDTQ